jgi:hypothetical protein
MTGPAWCFNFAPDSQAPTYCRNCGGHVDWHRPKRALKGRKAQ